MIFQIELVYGVDGVYGVCIVLPWNDCNQESYDPQGHITMLSATGYPQGGTTSSIKRQNIFSPKHLQILEIHVSEHF